VVPLGVEVRILSCAQKQNEKQNQNEDVSRTVILQLLIQEISIDTSSPSRSSN
jgi:hypothetical protein